MAFLSRLIACWRDRPDPASRVTGYRFRPGLETYDEAKAVAGYYRSLRQTESGRAIPIPESKRADVRTFPKKAVR